MVRVRLVPEGRESTVEVGDRLRVRDLLAKLGLPSEGVVVIRDGVPLTEDDYLDPRDEVEVVRVLSGG